MADADDLLSHLVTLGSEWAVVPEAEAMNDLGWDEGRLESALAGLPGLVERWPQAPAGPSLMLSEFTAAQQGWRLSIADGPHPNAWRWVAATTKEPPWKTAKSTRVVLESNLIKGAGDPPHDWLDRFEDKRAEPVERLAIRGERSESRGSSAGYFEPPKPVILLGYWMAWPAEGREDPIGVAAKAAEEAGQDVPRRKNASDPCPGCSGYRARMDARKALAKMEGRPVAPPSPTLCLICDWYTHDYRIPERIKREAEASKRNRVAPSKSYTGPARGLKGGIGA
jgi:hypothetical protein